jgi:(R,R)-butanediol dehydrogenase/meso-butanediol dehydrogenase/diacetyl reductase
MATGISTGPCWAAIVMRDCTTKQQQIKEDVMKAAVFRRLGAPLSVEDVAEPVAGPGEVVLRIAYCGVCGSDLHATHPGVFVVPDGTILGHEFTGEVVQSNATGIAAGQMVTALPLLACEDCRDQGECKDGLGMLCPRNTIIGFAPHAQGAYAEYIKVNGKHVVALPEGVGPREGATVEPLAVGLNAVETGEVRIGERVLILGAGPIGLAVTAFAKLAGAAVVAVSEYADGRRRMAEAFGATALINPAEQTDVAAAFAAAAGGPPDVVFECVGIPGMIQRCIHLARPRGRIVAVGVCMEEDRFVPISATFKAVSVRFMLGYEHRHFCTVLDLLRAGRIDPRPMITGEVDLAGLPVAFEALRTPKDQVKLLIRPRP